jgi:hypothetical protein
MLTVAQYLALRGRVVAAGHQDMIDWSEGLGPVMDPDDFWEEYAWVVLNSGMREQIARQIWERVRPAVREGHGAGSVFGYAAKARGIDLVYAGRLSLLRTYRRTPDAEKMAWLRHLPFIGPITVYHLAKNFGFDCAKPDRHLVRIAGAEGTHALCARLARETGDRIATVDVVIWRAANLRMI